MKKIFVAATSTIMILFVYLLFAADNNEKLNRLLLSAKTAPDSAKVYNIVASDYQSVNPELCISLSRRALELASSSGDQETISAAYINLGIASYNLNKLDSAFTLMQKGLKIAGDLGKPNYADAFGKMGSLYYLYSQEKDKDKKALKYYYNELRIRENNSEDDNIADTKENIGKIFYEWGYYLIAAEYFLDELELRKEENNTKETAEAMSNAAKSLMHLGKYATAADLFEDELKLREEENNKKAVSQVLLNLGIVGRYLGLYDESLERFRKSKELLSFPKDSLELKHAQKQIGLTYASMADKATKAGDYETAEENYLTARDTLYHSVGEADTNYTSLLDKLAGLYIKADEINKAVPVYEQVYELTKINPGENSPRHAIALKNLIDIYHAIGNTRKANKMIDEAQLLTGTDDQRFITFILQSKERSNNQLQKKKAENLILQQKNKIQEQEREKLQKDSIIKAKRIDSLRTQEIIKNQMIKKQDLELDNASLELENARILKWFLISVAGLLLIIVAGVFNRYRYKQKLAKILEDKNNALETANKHLSESEAALRASDEAKGILLNTLDNDLKRASDYAASLIPEPSILPMLSTQWRFVPSEKLGGDSLGYHWVDDEHFAFYLLDVCGHGVGSALMSVSALNMIRFQTLKDRDFTRPDDVMAGLNQAFQMAEHNDMYFTIWYGVFNVKTNKLSFAGAGHPPALIFKKDNSVEQINCENFLIGGLPEYPYQYEERDMSDTDRIYIFSDGAYELRKPDGNMMTVGDMSKLIKQDVDDSGSEIDDLYLKLKKINKKESLEDDFSMLRITLKK